MNRNPSQNCRPSPQPSPKGRGSRIALACLLAILALAPMGCARAWYRRQADWDAYNLVREKANHPHWANPNYTIALDPRSRMYDPYCADCPPLPPDDPTAHQFMHCVDKHRGWPFWHNNGDTPNVENPAWPAYIEFDEQGTMIVGADDAVRLGLLHSRQYQNELEDLYLSALDVSFERFRFQTQGFAGYQTFFTHDGRLRNGNGNSTSILEASTFSTGDRPNGWSLEKLTTTGGSIVVGFANSLVWQYSGPDSYTPNTLIDFTILQPLLKNAGRDRVLERLTRAERQLLYNVRIMEQYRQGFYVQIMTGRDTGQGVQRQGGVFGAGLEGFSGVGGGGFGRITTTAGGAANTSGGGGAGGGGAGGYIGLLQNQQVIRNQEDNVERLRRNLERLEAFRDELRLRKDIIVGSFNNIVRQELQVAQARQALFNAESTLLNSHNQYEQTLDAFKITLGLPPQLCFRVRDKMLDEFELIDPRTEQLQRQVDQIVRDFGAVPLRISQHVRSVEPDPNAPAASRNAIDWYPELDQDLVELKSRIESLRGIRQRLLDDSLPQLETDMQRLQSALPRRKESLLKLRERIVASKDDPCPLLPVSELNADVFRPGRLDESYATARAELDRRAVKIKDQYEAHLTERAAKLDEILAQGKTWTGEKLYLELYEGVLVPRVAAGGIRDILNEMPDDILALQLVQAQARSESIELAAVDIRAEKALDVARTYRRDWMNARANLVDSWRLIQFNADQLQSTLNVIFSGDISNVGDNPFNLNSNTGRLRTGFQFDAPITRRSERNVYRQALIEYQQARRSFYAFEDQVAATLRSELRTIYTNQINFEMQRHAVLIAAQQIEFNGYLQTEQEQSQTAGVTAARDAVSALSDLLTAQNNFLTIWTNYESLRRALDFDLGTLQLDSEGLWIDPGTIGEQYGEYDPWLWRTGDGAPACPSRTKSCLPI